MYLYASLQVACSLQPISLAEADIFSRTSDYPVISSYVRSISEKHSAILHLYLEIILKAVDAQPGIFSFLKDFMKSLKELFSNNKMGNSILHDNWLFLVLSSKKITIRCFLGSAYISKLFL